MLHIHADVCCLRQLEKARAIIDDALLQVVHLCACAHNARTHARMHARTHGGRKWRSWTRCRQRRRCSCCSSRPSHAGTQSHVLGHECTRSHACMHVHTQARTRNLCVCTSTCIGFAAWLCVAWGRMNELQQLPQSTRRTLGNTSQILQVVCACTHVCACACPWRLCLTNVAISAGLFGISPRELASSGISQGSWPLWEFPKGAGLLQPTALLGN